MTSRVFAVEEAAAELRKSKRWLLEWLRAHPRDAQGEPYYTPVGRDKILHQNDIARIECALREGIKCRSNSGRRGKVKRQILKSEGATSESMWKLAAELTNDPSLATRSGRLKSASKSTINTQRPSLHRIPGEPTFVSAAVAYMQAGGERAYMAPLLAHFDEILLKDVDQIAIDDAAKALLPQGAPDYQNRRIYTPISAVLHHALGDKCPTFKRPKGSKGRERKDFMWPEDAFAILEETEKIDREFGLYLRFLLYTGIRKSEGLKLLATDVRPEDRAAWLRDSKNGDPRMLKLRLDIVAPLFEHLKGHSSERFFRFNDGGHFKHLLLRATMAACGLPCPVRRPTGWKKPRFRLGFVTFHAFRHAWATWMRMYGGADLQGLKGTGNWRDLESVQRYAHVVARHEWDRVEALPTAKTGNKRGKAVNE